MIGKLIREGQEFVFVAGSGERRVLPCQLLKSMTRVAHKGNSLRLIVFSDYRVQDISALIHFVRSQERPDLILSGGDDIPRFRKEQKNLFQELAALSKYGLCAVAGNDDAPEVRELING